MLTGMASGDLDVSALLVLLVHELRTPANVVGGYLKLLQDPRAGVLSEHQARLLATRSAHGTSSSPCSPMRAPSLGCNAARASAKTGLHACHARLGRGRRVRGARSRHGDAHDLGR